MLRAEAVVAVRATMVVELLTRKLMTAALLLAWVAGQMLLLQLAARVLGLPLLMADKAALWLPVAEVVAVVALTNRGKKRFAATASATQENSATATAP